MNGAGRANAVVSNQRRDGALISAAATDHAKDSAATGRPGNALVVLVVVIDGKWRTGHIRFEQAQLPSAKRRIQLRVSRNPGISYNSVTTT